MSPTLIRTKIKALLAHLGISALLVAVAFWLVRMVWFPSPCHITDEAGHGLKLILLVDLVLGPLLTFVVFNPSKRRRLMVMDLALIAVAQLGAYGAGLYGIHSIRIQAVAFNEGQFHTIKAGVFVGQRITAQDWQALGPQPPYLVDVRAERTGEEQAGISAFAFTDGLSPQDLQFLYRPFTRHLADHAAFAYSAAQLPTALHAEAAHWPADAQFYPIQGYAENAVLVLSARGVWLGGFAGHLPVKQPAKPPAPLATP